MEKITDLFIVGGGINGVGIARDASGRGLSVTLVEKDDLASHTSSSSSKLIHGGLRYLEHYEFKLVRESLIEREILLQSAPHIIHPVRFILPHHSDMRPAFILRIGLFLYDHIGGRKLLPPTIVRDLTKHVSGSPLKAQFQKGFEYSDCWVDDARLVLLSAKDAAERGANILTRHEMISAKRKDGLWHIKVKNPDDSFSSHKSRAIVNAAGPWVDQIEENSSPEPLSKKSVRMVKGSHIIVPKIYDGEQAYTFQHSDGRIVFAIPYEKDFTLVGTTDVPFSGNANDVTITDEEIAYLCRVTETYFKRPCIPSSVVWSYSGVRPLVDDGSKSASKATRDYVLELDTQENAPLLSVYGGKITTFRHLAEDALERLQPHLGFKAKPWTAKAKLPGAEASYQNIEHYNQEKRQKYRFIPTSTFSRLMKAYGSNTSKIVGSATSVEDLGYHFGAGLYEAELIYMRDHEWAQTAEDALWRRSKLGLHMTEDERQAVKEWFHAKT